MEEEYLKDQIHLNKLWWTVVLVVRIDDQNLIVDHSDRTKESLWCILVGLSTGNLLCLTDSVYIDGNGKSDRTGQEDTFNLSRAGWLANYRHFSSYSLNPLNTYLLYGRMKERHRRHRHRAE